MQEAGGTFADLHAEVFQTGDHVVINCRYSHRSMDDSVQYCQCIHLSMTRLQLNDEHLYAQE